MRTRSTTIIAAGVMVAMLGGLTVFAYARSVQGSSASGPTTTAWTASSAIDAGTRGDAAARMFKRMEFPKSLVPHGAITDPASVTGRVAVRPIVSGEVITASQFGVATTQNGQPVAPASGLQIPPGTNAVTFNMPVPQGVGRYVQSGDLVNVFATFKQSPDGKDGPFTMLLLSNVQVLANQPAGTAAGKVGAGGDVLLTLALRPSDAGELVFAKETGSLWFALVHPGDEPASGGHHTLQSVSK